MDRLRFSHEINEQDASNFTYYDLRSDFSEPFSPFIHSSIIPYIELIIQKRIKWQI